MKNLIKCGAMREDFQRWLECGNGPLDVVRGKNGERGVATLFKLPRTGDIDYLYSAAMTDNAISWDHSPVFAGVYNHQDRSLYQTPESMRSDVLENLILPMDKDTVTMDAVISAEVNQRVEDIIANDRDRLSAAELTDWQFLRSLGMYQKQGARKDAVSKYIKGQEPDGMFHSEYKLDDLRESDFIAYLTSPDDFIQGAAETYIAAKQENILLEIQKSGLLLSEYQALMQDPNDPAHQMKAISDAVNGCGGRTVKVTLQKDGKKLTFETSVRSLAGHRYSYSTYGLPSEVQHEFGQMFGWHRDEYYLEDIKKITCGRQKIYEAPPVQTVEQGPVMQMGGM